MTDGTFRPSGATAWSSYNTPRIWAMVAAEDEPESWRQVAALGSMAGLLKHQRSRLEAAKRQLIEAWPPERNKAARVFVDEMDELLLTMRVNQEIADSNAGALGRVLEALRQAKAKVAPVYQSYLDKSDDWVPGWWDRAEEELDEQARQHMRDAEQLVALPDNTITAPGIYEFQADETRTRAGGGSGGGEPPARSGAGVAVPHEPPPALPRPESSGPSVSGPVLAAGPSLTEVIAPPATSAVTAPTGSPSQPGVVIGGGLPGGLPGRVPAGSRGGSTPLGGGVQRGLPGVVIGKGSPGQGSIRPVKPVPPSWLPPGPGPAARAGSVAGGRSAGSPVMPLGAGRGPAGDDRGAVISFDPDNPWAAAEGVAPVIEPSRKKYRHDPGPGVIGWRG